jgi:hypothetical protein
MTHHSDDEISVIERELAAEMAGVDADTSSESNTIDVALNENSPSEPAFMLDVAVSGPWSLTTHGLITLDAYVALSSCLYHYPLTATLAAARTIR